MAPLVVARRAAVLPRAPLSIGLFNRSTASTLWPHLRARRMLAAHLGYASRLEYLQLITAPTQWCIIQCNHLRSSMIVVARSPATFVVLFGLRLFKHRVSIYPNAWLRLAAEFLARLALVAVLVDRLQVTRTIDLCVCPAQAARLG